MNLFKSVCAFILTIAISMAVTACGGSGGSESTPTASANTLAYSIGGNIAELIGTLVLQNNSDDDLTINSDGNFTFTTKVADGANYSVTVKTQPEHQTCTVSNGTGTVAGNDITDVDVVCSTNTYSVGGNVTGLIGTLVLQNSSGDDLTINSDGNFTFTTKIADNANYSVTVKTQPEHQTCTVSNGTGTVTGNDITDVDVVCSTNTYSVGGNVTDLVGTLVLQNNSGDDLTINSDGNFTFTTKVADGANYSVTVKTQPISQLCTISNDEGVMSGSDITNVSIDCVNIWAETFATSPSASNFYDITSDKNGNLYAAGTLERNGTFQFGSVSVKGDCASGNNGVVIKYDEDGATKWAYSTSTASNISLLHSITADADGNIYAVGYIYKNTLFTFKGALSTASATGAFDGYNIVIVKYDSNGIVRWANTTTSALGKSLFNAVAADSNKNVYAVGYINTSNQFTLGGQSGTSKTVQGAYNGINPLIVKYDSNGKIKWTRTVSSALSSAKFNGVSVDDNGNIYAVGNINGKNTFNLGNGVTVNGANASNNAFIVKYDSDGNAIWAKSTTTASDMSAFNGVSSGSSEGVYAVGRLNGNGEFDFGGVTVSGDSWSQNILIVRYDADGNAIWAKSASTASTANSSLFNDVSVDDDGNAYAAGNIYGGTSLDFGNGVHANAACDSDQNILMVKYNSDGKAKWAKTTSSATWSSDLFGICTDDYGNPYGAGNINMNFPFTFDGGITAQGDFNGGNALIIKY